MHFFIGFVKNNNSVVLKEFKLQEAVNTHVADLDEINDKNISLLLYSKENCDLETLKNLSKNIKHYPIRDASDFNINIDNFEKASDLEIINIVYKSRQTWVLQNNMSLLDELFKVVDHLGKLFLQDRTSFFEEFWFLLKSNIGCTALKVVYNDIWVAPKDSNTKNQLIQTRMEGVLVPNPVSGNSTDKLLIDSYKKEFSNNFEIQEFAKEKEELVATVTFNQSPVLIMANTQELSRLSKSVISALCDGINHILSLSSKK